MIQDHPLDEVYRKKFQEAKMMKLKGLTPNNSAPLGGEGKRQGSGFPTGPVFGAK